VKGRVRGGCVCGTPSHTPHNPTGQAGDTPSHRPWHRKHHSSRSGQPTPLDAQKQPTGSLPAAPPTRARPSGWSAGGAPRGLTCDVTSSRCARLAHAPEAHPVRRAAVARPWGYLWAGRRGRTGDALGVCPGCRSLAARGHPPRGKAVFNRGAPNGRLRLNLVLGRRQSGGAGGAGGTQRAADVPRVHRAR
jgi:hypothetical protein